MISQKKKNCKHRKNQNLNNIKNNNDEVTFLIKVFDFMFNLHRK